MKKPTQFTGNTFFFSDLQGSTPMSQAPGKAKFVKAILLHNALVENAIRAAKGFPMKGDGDCWTGLFPSPKAALECAIAVQQALAKVPAWADSNGTEWKLKVRIGLHHLGDLLTVGGENEIERIEKYPRIVYAQRVMGLANGEQILVSKGCYDKLEGGEQPAEWLAFPNLMLKGIPGPHTVYERLWDGKTKGSPNSHWLPAWLRRYSNQFVGRETYLQEISDWMKSDKACLVMHGFGGIGKTRLASQAMLAVADYFEGKIYAAAMENLSLLKPDGARKSKEEIEREFAGAIGRAVFGEGAQFQEAETEVPKLLNDETDRLILLDNFENFHCSESRNWLAKLLRAAPNLKCLVTSRILFQLGSNSHDVHIEGFQIPKNSRLPLEEQDGYQLFKARTDQHKPIKLLDDTQALVRILDATEGFALGIELTAAQFKSMTLDEIAEGLQKSLLDAQDEDATPGNSSEEHYRHKTLEGCISWSFNLLSEEERTAFLQLGVFPGDFLKDAAEAVANAPHLWLMRWMDAHLIEGDRLKQAKTIRYSLLPVVCEWAMRHLNASGGTDGAQKRFATHYAERAEGWKLHSLPEVFAFANELENFHRAVETLGEPTLENANGYVYLGLSKTATGPEFNIIDVHDANNLKWIGGYRIGASINQIYVRAGYAYLTDDDKSRELVVLDVHNPANPTLASTFDPTGTLGYEVGKSLYTRGDILFTGMSFAFASPELYVLNIAHPYGTTRIASSIIGSSVMGIFARDSLLFVLTSTIKQFMMLDISDLASIKPYGSPTILPGSGASLDCEGNYFFVGSNKGIQGTLSIIGPHV